MSNDELIAALCSKIIELNDKCAGLDTALAVMERRSTDYEAAVDRLRAENAALYEQQQHAWRARELALITENNELRTENEELRAQIQVRTLS